MNKNLHKSLLAILFGLMCTAIAAQESPRQHELGLTFSNLDRFGLTYRLGKNDKLWRINLIQSNATENEGSDDNSIWQTENFSLELGIGREIRKPIDERFSLRYGLDLSVGFFHSKSLAFGRFDASNDFLTKTRRWRAALGVLGGLNYKINERILLGAELLPSFGYERSNSDRERDGTFSESESEGYSFRFSNGGALLSLIYTF